MRNLETKKVIREQILEERSTLDVLVWQDYTETITRKVIEHDWFREATDIYCYVDCKGEPGTRLIIEEAWKLGKSVWVPKVVKPDITFYEITSYDDLKPGHFGVLEPITDTLADNLDGLVIVPGVAFDNERNRIGYGKGYYDRFLSANPTLHTIAIAFDMQVLAAIPHEESDVRPQVLITELQMIEEMGE